MKPEEIRYQEAERERLEVARKQRRTEQNRENKRQERLRKRLRAEYTESMPEETDGDESNQLLTSNQKQTIPALLAPSPRQKRIPFNHAGNEAAESALQDVADEFDTAAEVEQPSVFDEIIEDEVREIETSLSPSPTVSPQVGVQELPVLVTEGSTMLPTFVPVVNFTPRESKIVELRLLAKKHKVSENFMKDIIRVACGIPADLQHDEYEQKHRSMFAMLIGACYLAYYCPNLCVGGFIGKLVQATGNCPVCGVTVDGRSKSFLLAFDVRETLLNVLQKTKIGRTVIEYSRTRTNAERECEYGEYFRTLNAQPSASSIPLLLTTFSDSYSQYSRSQTSVWVQTATIDNLPVSQRIAMHIPILFALKTKTNHLPPNHILMHHFKTSMEALATNPLHWSFANITIVSTAIPYLYTFDSPERLKQCECDGVSGFLSCTHCRFKGTRVEHTTCFPPVISTSVPRTREDFLTANPLLGIKGRSALADVPVLGENLPLPIVIDIMHCSCEGVLKAVLQKLIKCCLKDNEKLIKEIDAKFDDCSVPSQFRTSAQSLLLLATMPAKQIFFYAVYVEPLRLRRVIEQTPTMGKEAQELLMALALAHQILVDDDNGNDFVLFSKQLIDFAVSRMQSLFGWKSLTYNWHAVQHLPEQRRLHGPLLRISAFCRESYIGTAKNCVKSGNAILQQFRHAAGSLLNLNPETGGIVGHETEPGLYGCQRKCSDPVVLITCDGHYLERQIELPRVPFDIKHFVEEVVGHKRLTYYKGLKPRSRSLILGRSYWTRVLHRSLPEIGSCFFFTGKKQQTCCYLCEIVAAVHDESDNIMQVLLLSRKVGNTIAGWMPTEIESVEIPLEMRTHYFTKGLLSSSMGLVSVNLVNNTGFNAVFECETDEHAVVTRISFDKGIVS